jgi:hypothetical protein
MERIPIHSVKLKHDNHIFKSYILRDETTACRLEFPTMVAVA